MSDFRNCERRSRRIKYLCRYRLPVSKMHVHSSHSLHIGPYPPTCGTVIIIMQAHKFALYFVLSVFAIGAVFLAVMFLIECSKALTRPPSPLLYYEMVPDAQTKRKADGKNKQF